MAGLFDNLTDVASPGISAHRIKYALTLFNEGIITAPQARTYLGITDPSDQSTDMANINTEANTLVGEDERQRYLNKMEAISDAAQRGLANETLWRTTLNIGSP